MAHVESTIECLEKLRALVSSDLLDLHEQAEYKLQLLRLEQWADTLCILAPFPYSMRRIDESVFETIEQLLSEIRHDIDSCECPWAGSVFLANCVDAADCREIMEDARSDPRAIVSENGLPVTNRGGREPPGHAFEYDAHDAPHSATSLRSVRA